MIVFRGDINGGNVDVGRMIAHNNVGATPVDISLVFYVEENAGNKGAARNYPAAYPINVLVTVCVLFKINAQGPGQHMEKCNAKLVKLPVQSFQEEFHSVTKIGKSGGS